jgi:hypothetical protein
VFHQPLRQTEGLLRSIADVLGVSISMPDHTTLSRRGGGLTILPKTSIAPSHCISWSTARVSRFTAKARYPVAPAVAQASLWHGC